jgi:hypothetical protein
MADSDSRHGQKDHRHQPRDSAAQSGYNARAWADPRSDRAGAVSGLDGEGVSDANRLPTAKTRSADISDARKKRMYFVRQNGGLGDSHDECPSFGKINKSDNLSKYQLLDSGL